MSVALARVESWEEHVEAWHHLGRQVDGAAWGRAAVAASLKGRYGENAVAKFAQEVGFSRRSIYAFARTFEAFPEECDRLHNLTFSHHRHAAELTENAKKARAALEQAAREGWSTNALRAQLRQPAQAQTATPAACSTVSGACGPITTDDKIFHISALVENFYAVKDYELDPLVSVGTKKSLKELSKKIHAVVAWLESLNKSINGRIG